MVELVRGSSHCWEQTWLLLSSGLPKGPVDPSSLPPLTPASARILRPRRPHCSRCVAAEVRCQNPAAPRPPQPVPFARSSVPPVSQSWHLPADARWHREWTAFARVLEPQKVSCGHTVRGKAMLRSRWRLGEA